jgi:hypothetical protein
MRHKPRWMKGNRRWLAAIAYARRSHFLALGRLVP